MKLTYNAYAKINLILDVTGVKKNGYHTIFSVMQSIGLKDVITVEKTKGEKITISCTDETVPTDSKNIVYNTFPLPNLTEDEKTKIKQTAQSIFDGRKLYPDSSLADLYDDLTMPPELRKAHQENDKVVMEAYEFDWRTMTESECVAELMKKYQKLNED